MSNPTATQPTFADLACTAFDGTQQVAQGRLGHVALKIRKTMGNDPFTSILIFDDATGRVVDVDYRGSSDDILERLIARTVAIPAEAPVTEVEKKPAGPGRPKLGVIGREVTLLPRHWSWLDSQSGGASVALRRLVEQARKDNEKTDRLRAAREATNRFLTTVAGDLHGYEEATRALFGGNADRFGELIRHWPADVRDYAFHLSAEAFETVLV
jgi:hypothetical protein